MLTGLEEKIASDLPLLRDEAMHLTSLSGHEIFEFMAAASRIRNRFRGDQIALCAIINAKSGACPEDCAYCAQSSRSSSVAAVFPLVDKEIILEKAAEAKRGGARRFCIVTSGRKVSAKEIESIASSVSAVRGLGLLPCVTLGLLCEEEIRYLKKAGLERFHHNLETSRRFFPSICSTHTYEDKIRTIEATKAAGVSLCSGGIFGLGEEWSDRVDMALALREIGADSVPINFLIPIKGTRLGFRKTLEPLEALKIISLFRFVLPDREIRVCGGRVQALGELHPFIFPAGADGLLTGNYLTTLGRSFEDDLMLINHCGFRIR
jgi:biotin synthase